MSVLMLILMRLTTRRVLLLLILDHNIATRLYFVQMVHLRIIWGRQEEWNGVGLSGRWLGFVQFWFGLGFNVD